ncbi:hypothetical protein [Nocardia sp. NBC_01329]|uniref:hypothetical protein n=1 Tax=Nocardia sp. NBC_01329 TaxID=2903594 RepID=UPI002E1420C2|nr:hypothetical protein OG405_24975 [Nocardia sp. NBC_01329]
MPGVTWNKRFSTLGAIFTGVAVAGISVIGAGPAQAAPPGIVHCAAVPVDSRVEVECTNTDVGAATAGMAGLCTNLRILYRQAERMRGESTIEWAEDCGPGAHPILWNAWGETDYQRSFDDD